MYQSLHHQETCIIRNVKENAFGGRKMVPDGILDLLK